ncbi:MAG TPA: CpaD family pilus assembly protein [Xanthobacteraceae bacterium]|nr:CpaD family pilus assembly protein [Xanthobacteraceae bacterium]
MRCHDLDHDAAVVRRRSALARALGSGLMVAGLAAALAGCNTTTARDTTGSIPTAYAERHPIAIKEGKKSLVVLVGTGRGGLSATQRAEVLAFARNWRHDATGGVTVDRPVGVTNERAVNDTLKETLSILTQADVPHNGIGVRPYHPPGGQLGTLRLNYPLMVADAGPCGLWPDDVGPSYDPKHFENKQYYNFGCAAQRNLAAMVAEPADLIQPRSETPAYTAKRTFGLDKWRKGQSPETIYPNADKGKISEVGQ